MDAIASSARVILAGKAEIVLAGGTESMRRAPYVVSKGQMTVVSVDEHPRETSLEAMAKLPTPFRTGETVTSGNSSGVKDGACAVVLAGADAVKHRGLTPRARVVGTAVALGHPLGASGARRVALRRSVVRAGYL